MTLSISEVAAATGLRASALRYYEDVGLIRAVERRGGRRHYNADVVPRLAFIALCQEVGFTLGQVGTLLDSRPDASGLWQELGDHKLAEIQREIEQLQERQRRLRAALACTCERVDGCQLVGEAGRRRRTHAQPEATGPRSTSRS